MLNSKKCVEFRRFYALFLCVLRRFQTIFPPIKTVILEVDLWKSKQKKVI